MTATNRAPDGVLLEVFTLLRRAFDGDTSAEAEIARGPVGDPAPVVTSFYMLARAVVAVAGGDRAVDVGHVTSTALDLVDREPETPANLRAAIHAVRAVALLPQHLEDAVSEHVRARALVTQDVHGHVDVGYAQLALNWMTIFCIRLGLVDEATDFARRAATVSKLWYSVPPAPYDGAAGSMNVVLMALHAGLGPLAEHDQVRRRDLVGAGTMAAALAGDPRIVGPRYQLMRVVQAVVEAFTGTADRAWELLPGDDEWWGIAQMPASALWVIAAAQATRSQFLDLGRRPRVGEFDATLERVREAYRRMVDDVRTPAHALSYLAAAASAQVLLLERAVARTGAPNRVQQILDDRDRFLRRMVTTSRHALSTALTSRIRTEMLFESNLQLTRRTQVDTLTNAGSRYSFEDAVAQWQDGEGLGVVIADVDHFKTVNDEFGHILGDSVLREVGRLLGSVVREADRLYRYGGDEFVVIVRDAEPAVAAACAHRMRLAVEHHDWSVLHPDLRVRVTTGVAAGGAHPMTLLNDADVKLLAAKAAR